jgi:uncharacterized protein
VRFAWDRAKDEANQQKHGIGFAEAIELLASGVDFLEIYDEDHSADEERFIAVGPISRGLVVIVWTERDAETVRIISARKATKREAQLFREYMGERS